MNHSPERPKRPDQKIINTGESLSEKGKQSPHKINYMYIKAKYIVALWVVSYIAIAATIAFSMLWSLIFLLPFVVSSVYIGRHSAQMLRELKLDMETEDEFI